LREEMRVELKKLIKKVGISALYVTHDQEEAFVISDTVIVMDRGRIVQYDVPDEIYCNPATPFVAGFIGRSALIDGKLVKLEGGNCLVTVPDFGDAILVCRASEKARVGDSCCLVIRTREIKLNTQKFVDLNNVLEGVVLGRDYRGGLTDNRIRVGSKEIVVTSHNLCPMINLGKDGSDVFLHIDQSAISVILNPQEDQGG